jgi:hypothetical protein
MDGSMNTNELTLGYVVVDIETKALDWDGIGLL